MADIGNIETATQLILAEALCNAQGDSRFAVEEFLDEAVRQFDGGKMSNKTARALQLATQKAIEFCNLNCDGAFSYAETHDYNAAATELAAIMIRMLKSHVSDAIYARVLADANNELLERLEDGDTPSDMGREIAGYAVTLVNYHRVKPKRDNVVQMFPRN